ncbi:MAG: hypothetical protein J6X53_02135, partial [Abditibacteriota bacterium]|nr:hypothetical protein [Abditibacteriota bacterium]
MAKKQTSAEAENPMETMETVGMEAESGFERRDEEPGAEIIGPRAEYEALPMDQNGMNNDGSGFPPDVFPDENGLSPGWNGPPSGGIPPEWEEDSSGYSGHLDGIPDSPGVVSPDALSAVLDGVEVLASGDGRAGDDVVIPYGEDAPEDSQPPDDTLSGGPPPDMEENPEISTGQIGGSETAPPVAAGAVRRRTTQTRARTAGDSASGSSVGAADVPASRTSSQTNNESADSGAFAFRTPTPAPVVLSPAPASAVPARRRGSRPPAGDAADRAAFFGLQFNRLDRNLTPEQRQEWNSIYASYRGRSVMSGTIVGVDRARVMARNPETGEMEPKQIYFAVVIPYRVRIVIPQTEMWFPGEERPDFVLRNMDGAKIDFIIFKVDRENGLAVGSRKMTLPSRRYYFSTQPQMHTPGSSVQCSVMAVG